MKNIICKVNDCENKHSAKGFCVKHYQRFTRYGSAHFVKHVRHGMTHSVENNAYRHMLARCTNPKDKGYINYGGRGIKVCDRWTGQYGFLNFLEDMGSRPKGKSLDRINNDGNYEPSNCRWATIGQQQRNRRCTIWVDFDGRKMILADMAKKYNINVYTLRARLFKYKWPIEQALNRPIGK